MKIEELIRNGKPVIDVRTRPEYFLGHARNTINIPLPVIPEKIDELKEMDPPLLLCCRSGMRSGQAVDMLRQEGIECLNVGSWKNLTKLSK